MNTLDDQILLMERYLRDARRMVENQRERIANGKAASPVAAMEMLVTFERALATFKRDLDRLLSQKHE